MARESFDPCHVADALWKQVAMEGILYGIKVASVTKEILRKLDSIQAHVGAFILGVRQTCSHDAIRKELGWKSMSTIIYTRKLLYWERLASLDTENWAHLAFKDCHNSKGKINGDLWLSSWRKEIQEIFVECKIVDAFKYHISRKKSIKKVIEEWELKQLAEACKGSSLRGMPEYEKTNKMQSYVDHSEASMTIAKFRLGDARLGNRSTPVIKDCRLCHQGRNNNNEAHIIFSCNMTGKMLNDDFPALQHFKEKHKNKVDENGKLKYLLGGDGCSREELMKRGKELATLLLKIHEVIDIQEFSDMLRDLRD